MGKIDDNLDFCQHLFSENLDFNQYLRDNRIVTKFSPNIGFGQNFRKMSIWVKIWKYVDLRQNL